MGRVIPIFISLLARHGRTIARARRSGYADMCGFGTYPGLGMYPASLNLGMSMSSGARDDRGVLSIIFYIGSGYPGQIAAQAECWMVCKYGEYVDLHRIGPAPVSHREW